MLGAFCHAISDDPNVLSEATISCPPGAFPFRPIYEAGFLFRFLNQRVRLSDFFSLHTRVRCIAFR